MIEIDEFDEKILKIVRLNNWTPAEKIAGRVGLSTSAVQRRLQRLRKEKIIQADISIVAPAVSGPAMTAVVGVTLEKENSVILNEFRSKIRAAPEIVQSYYVTGEVDFILIVAFKNMPEFESFAERFLTENPYVKRYNTNIVISEIKSLFDAPEADPKSKI
jgi:Lrp/AsnC family transcriptional regulator, leucine-responsive regulatory protein